MALTILLLLGTPVALMVTAPAGPAVDPTMVVQIAITAVIAVRLGYELHQDGRPLTTVFWTLTYILFALAPLAQLGLGRGLPGTQDPLRSMGRAQAIVVVSLVTFELGRAASRSTFPVLLSAVVPDARRSKRLALAAFPLALPMITTVGLESLFRSRVAVAQALQQGDSKVIYGVLLSLGRVPGLIALLSLLFLAHAQKERGEHVDVRDRALMVAVAALVFLVTSPLSAPRFAVATVIVGIHFAVKRSPGATRRFILLLIAFAVLAFPVSDYFRRDERLEVERRHPAVELAGYDYDAMILLAAATDYTDYVGHSFGTRALSATLFFVPRSAWPGKSRDSGSDVGQFLRRRNLNLSMPLQGELYLDFGPLGVGIGFLLIGVVVAALDRSYGAQGGGILVAVITGYSLLVMRGSLLQATGVGVMMVVVSLYVRVREPVVS